MYHLGVKPLSCAFPLLFFTITWWLVEGGSPVLLPHLICFTPHRLLDVLQFLDEEHGFSSWIFSKHRLLYLPSPKASVLLCTLERSPPHPGVNPFHDTPLSSKGSASGVLLFHDTPPSSTVFLMLSQLSRDSLEGATTWTS